MREEDLLVIDQKRRLWRPMTQQDLDELRVYLEEREANGTLDALEDNEDIFLEMIRNGANPAQVQAVLVIS